MAYVSDDLTQVSRLAVWIQHNIKKILFVYSFKPTRATIILPKNTAVHHTWKYNIIL